MYGTYKASLRHDRIIVLLGMAMHDEPGALQKYRLLLDHNISWAELLRRLVRTHSW